MSAVNSGHDWTGPRCRLCANRRSHHYVQFQLGDCFMILTFERAMVGLGRPQSEVLRPKPESRASTTAWARLLTPSLLKMMETWLRTVLALVPSFLAMLSLSRPWARSSSTSFSRAV